MTKRKKKFNIKRLKSFVPYFLVSFFAIVLVILGTIDKKSAEMNISLDAFMADNYKVSADQLSELYVVADLSDALGLASATDVASNYVIADTMYEAGQTSSGRLEKPNITNIAASRGVIEYTVSEGENADTIAAKFKLSVEQVRWSNGLKTSDIAAGTVLHLPSTAGIVYTVKSGDTLESIVEKYGSSITELVALNDLEVSGINEGMRIVIKNGSLPEKERPEYVAPAPARTYTYAYTYTYSGSSSSRQDPKIIAYNFYDPNYSYPNPNPGVPGYCTWYAWWWRATNPASLGTLGHEGRNASAWNYNYAYRGVGRTPVVGAVFQTPYGGYGYGHVGVVVGINGDGSIVVREMNYYGRSVVSEATIPANYVGNFNYIY